MKMKSIIAGVFAAIVAISASASAQTFFGDTTGGPTFNRPFGTAQLSGVGTNVAYEVNEFTISDSGSYTFNLNAQTSGFDTYLLIYQNVFNPLNQLSNLLAANDDGGPGLNSQATLNLATGTNYFAVVTGFDNGDFGAYELIARSDVGSVSLTSAIPEPATWLMMILGFAGVGLQLRRRNREYSYTKA
jgi:hypothetical protein